MGIMDSFWKSWGSDYPTGASASLRTNVLGAQTGGLSSSPGVRSYSPTNFTPAQTYNVADQSPRPKGYYDVASQSPRPTSQGGGGEQPFQYPEFNQPAPDEPFGGGPSEQDVINDEFNRFNDYLGQQESQSRQNFEETKGLYDKQLASGKERYSKEKETQTEDVKKTEALNLKKVRDLLRDLSQADAARVAIYGGGSTAEALGARFGRESQSRLGTVMDQSAAALERVNTFYNNSITKLQENYDSAILGAKQTLDANLSQINQQRGASAAAKQQGMMQAWKDYYNNVNQAKVQAAQFKAQYDMWKQQQDNAYSATSGFNLSNADQYNQGLSGAYGDMPNAQGQAETPYSMNKYFRVGKREDEEDPLSQLGYGKNFMNNLQAGITP